MTIEIIKVRLDCSSSHKLLGPSGRFPRLHCRCCDARILGFGGHLSWQAQWNGFGGLKLTSVASAGARNLFTLMIFDAHSKTQPSFDTTSSNLCTRTTCPKFMLHCDSNNIRVRQRPPPSPRRHFDVVFGMCLLCWLLDVNVDAQISRQALHL